LSGSYDVRFRRSAEKELEGVDGRIRARILRNVAALADDPRPPGVKRLAGADNLWRIRVGDYRVVYEIRDTELIIRVVRIAHRSKVYRGV
jgi:mRNA interferase RelE/StbE